MRQTSPKAQALALERRDAVRRSPRREHQPATDATMVDTEHDERYWAELRQELNKPDDRCVGAAYGFDEIRAAPTMVAASGFMVLLLYLDNPTTRRVAGFSSWPIVCWRLVDGSCPLPVCFGINIEFHPMCHLAIRSPDGSVAGFDYGQFANTRAWLRNRKRELRRRR
jgi:hypothetical protein